MFEILTIGNEILARKAQTVDNIDDSVKELINNMFDIMNQSDGVGLAAPQIGLSSRIFITNIENDIQRVFINPELIFTSPEEIIFEEGCLSIPGLYRKVKRSLSIKIQALNERGRHFNLETDGFLARVILHEYDHLEGILFVDRLSAIARNRALEEYARKLKG